MILPLNLLIGNKSNRYELTVASIRRAQQLSVTADREENDNSGKIVSIAVQQILTKKIRYEITSSN